MFRLRAVVPLVALAVLTAGLSAAENPRVKQLHEEIHALKAQEKVTVKAIHDWYTAFINRDKLTEEDLREERKALHAQEEELVKVAPTVEARKEVRAHYDALRAYLAGDVKRDAATIKELRALEKAHETLIRNTYKAAVADLEEQAKLASSRK